MEKHHGPAHAAEDMRQSHSESCHHCLKSQKVPVLVFNLVFKSIEMKPLLSKL